MLALVVDSSSALTREEARQLSAEFVPMTYQVDGAVRDEGFLGENAGYAELLAEGRISGTAGVPTERFVPVFRELTARGDDVLCITISAKLSSTCLHAREAADLVRSELRRQAGATSREANSAARARTAGLPRIAVLDSQSGIGGVENLARHARALADSGLGFDEILGRLERLRELQGLCFSVPSTDALRASGRLAMVPLSVNTLLNRYPILTMEGGAINHVGTARGTAALAREMVACVPANAAPDFIITHFGDRGAATAELLRAVKSAFPQATIRVKDGGPVLSSILGPGAVSLIWGVDETASAQAPLWQVQAFDELPEDAVTLRTAVFMDEQGFAEEFDELDSSALHLVGYLDGRPVACARVYWHEDRHCYVVGRIAVDRDLRGQSLGSHILAAAEREILARRGTRCELLAQEQAAPFYEKQGYARSTETCLDEGCPHVWMAKQLG